MILVCAVVLFCAVLCCAVGLGSAADACGVTNKEGCGLIKPSNGFCCRVELKMTDGVCSQICKEDEYNELSSI